MISALLTARRGYLTTTTETDILTKSPEQLHAESRENEEKQKEEQSQISNLDNNGHIEVGSYDNVYNT